MLQQEVMQELQAKQLKQRLIITSTEDIKDKNKQSWDIQVNMLSMS